MAYKKDQGRHARLAAFWSLAILAFYGCTSLHTQLVGNWPVAMKSALIDSVRRIPVLTLDLNAALLIATAALGAGLWLLHRYLERPRTADLLIETETELRKVTWPTMPEAVRSSVVVILCVVVLMAFLAFADYAFGRWSARLLLGG